MNSDVGELPPVRAERRENAAGDVLMVDPIAIAALAQAKIAGMTRAADIASLPSAEELPLRLVVAETRLAILETKFDAIVRMGSATAGRLRDIRTEMMRKRRNG